MPTRRNMLGWAGGALIVVALSAAIIAGVKKLDGPANRHSDAATLVTFAGYWWGHDRGLRITRDGRASEALNSGCCDRVIDLKFRLSRPRGSTRVAKATATVTAVRVRDHSVYSPAHPAPHIDETWTLPLRHGVIEETLTGTNYCAPEVGKCGA